jgi:hypothetical protein
MEILQKLGIVTIFYNILHTILPRGHAVVEWLRHDATRWKVAGSRPDEVDFLN